MAPRQPLNFNIRSPGRRPMASPVDTYGKTGAGAALDQLAEGLSVLAPGVGQFSTIVAREMAEQSKKEGEAYARKLIDEGRELAEMSQAGELPLHENSFFMKSFYEQFGSVTADRWAEDFTGDFNTDPATKEIRSMEQYDSYVRAHRQKWMEDKVGAERNLDFEAGFGSKADARYAQKRYEFASGLDNKLKKESDRILYSEIFSAIQEYGGMNDLSGLAGNIQGLMQGSMATGRVPTEVTATALDAIINGALRAEEKGNGMNALQLLDMVYGTDGVSLGTSPEGAPKYDAARQEIAQRMHQNNTRSHQQQEWDREERGRNAIAEALKLSPNDADYNSKMQTIMGGVSDIPGISGQLAQLHRDRDTLTETTRLPVYRKLYSGIYSPDPVDGPVTELEVLREYNGGRLNRQDADHLIDEIRSLREQGGVDGGIFADRQFRDTVSGLERQFKDITGDITGEVGTRKERARFLLYDGWIQLHKSGQLGKMDHDARRKWLFENMTRIVEEQRGPDAVSINPPPPAQFQTQEEMQAKLPKDLVLTEEEIYNIQNGNPLPGYLNQINRLQLNQDERGEFVKMQIRFFMEKTGRLPKPAAQNPKE